LQLHYSRHKNGGVWSALDFSPCNYPHTVSSADQPSIFPVLVPYIVEVLLCTVLILLAATLTLPISLDGSGRYVPSLPSYQRCQYQPHSPELGLSRSQHPPPHFTPSKGRLTCHTQSHITRVMVLKPWSSLQLI